MNILFAAFLKGMALGLALATLIGPVFFALIQTAIRQGTARANFMAIGVSASDALYVFLTYFGLAQFSDNELFINIMAFGGGIVLVVMGLVMIFKKSAIATEDKDTLTRRDRLHSLMKGFTLNFINPSVLIFWVGVVGVVSLDYGYDNARIAVFFSGAVTTVFGTDLLKIQVAKRLGSLLKENVLLIINRIAGLLMIAYGLKLFLEKLYF